MAVWCCTSTPAAFILPNIIGKTDPAAPHRSTYSVRAFPVLGLPLYNRVPHSRWSFRRKMLKDYWVCVNSKFKSNKFWMNIPRKDFPAHVWKAHLSIRVVAIFWCWIWPKTVGFSRNIDLAAAAFQGVGDLEPPKRWWQGVLMSAKTKSPQSTACWWRMIPAIDTK